jgi:hypothetical protein
VNVSPLLLVVYRQNRCVLYSTFAANYSVQQLVCAMSTLVPVKSNNFTVLHIQATVFKWTYLRYCWWCVRTAMLAILHTFWQMQRTSAGLRYVNSGAGQIQCHYSFANSGFIIQINVPPLLLQICRQLDARHTSHFLPNTAHILLFTLCQIWSLSNRM